MVCPRTIGDIESGLIDLMSAAGFSPRYPGSTTIYLRAAPSLDKFPTRAHLQIRWQFIPTSAGVRMIANFTILDMAATRDTPIRERPIDNPEAMEALQETVTAIAQQFPCAP